MLDSSLRELVKVDVEANRPTQEYCPGGAADRKDPLAQAKSDERYAAVGTLQVDLQDELTFCSSPGNRRTEYFTEIDFEPEKSSSSDTICLIVPGWFPIK